MKRATGVTGIVVGVVLLGMAGVGWAANMLVDDFNRGEKPNALGGDFGSWDRDPNDATQTCVISFDKASAFGGVGFSLRVDYDVDSPNPAYNGVWMDLKGMDLSAAKKLTFYIKGDAARGYTNRLKLEIKNGRETGHYVLKGITDQWQQVSVPLKAFEGMSDWKVIRELVMVFDDLTVTKKVGTIYLDEILFES